MDGGGDWDVRWGGLDGRWDGGEYPAHRDGGGGGGGDCGRDGGACFPRREFGVFVSQYPPGQQPQYPQQQGYPQQGQYPQQYPAPYSPYQMPQVHPMAYAQAQVQGLG